MKLVLFVVFLFAIGVFQSTKAIAADAAEMRVDADQYYDDQNFKKAHKLYYKLAKTGDYYSQGRVSHMYAKGEGKSADFIDAYAWSVLAEEGGESFVIESSDKLLSKTSNKEDAKKEADKLLGKYGQKALALKEQKRTEMNAARRTGNSMGSNLSR